MPKTNMLKFDAASVAGEKQVRLVLTPRMDDGVIGMSGTIAYLLFTNGFNFIASDSTDKEDLKRFREMHTCLPRFPRLKVR
jgi:hypothetical protein